MVEVEYSDPESFADEVTGYGPDVLVLEPRRSATPWSAGSREPPPHIRGRTHERHRTAGAKRVPESATDRLSRLLTMVPWLVNRQGIDIAEAAAGLGVTEKQLEDDLQLLFMCGYGQMPDELIDAQWEGGRVFVTNADTIARPLRLGVDEALTLMVGLRALAAVPGIGERAAIERALAKLEQATGASAAAAARVDVAIDEAWRRSSSRTPAVR